MSSNPAAGVGASERQPDGILAEMFSLRGKVALVTGAAGGIGRTFAAGARASRARPWRCATSMRLRSSRWLAGIEAEGGAAKGFFVDLSRQASILALRDQVKAGFGRIDILVNCAAINKREPILEVEESTYDRIMAVNLRGLYQLSRAVVPLMPETGGKIVNIGSINSEIGLSNVSVYGATKGAVKQLTKVMAVEWASRNIQVNSIIPGRAHAAVGADLGGRGEAALDVGAHRHAASGRAGGTARHGDLPSSKASSYVTGQSFIIDGGVMAGGTGWA